MRLYKDIEDTDTPKHANAHSFTVTCSKKAPPSHISLSELGNDLSVSISHICTTHPLQKLEPTATIGGQDRVLHLVPSSYVVGGGGCTESVSDKLDVQMLSMFGGKSIPEFRAWYRCSCHSCTAVFFQRLLTATGMGFLSPKNLGDARSFLLCKLCGSSMRILKVYQLGIYHRRPIQAQHGTCLAFKCNYVCVIQ